MTSGKDEIDTSKRSEASGPEKRKSSILERISRSFRRGGGGTESVETLRGTRGADFEGPAIVTRGVEGIGTSCCFCFRSGNAEIHKERYLLIKGPFCFVFSNETADSPKYAIGLQYSRPNIKSTSGSSVNVLLENNLGDVQYEICFTSQDIAKEFARAVEKQAASAQAEMVRKRLGHENLLSKRTSVRLAENIAKKKENEQPDVPVTTTEIMENMPQVVM